MPGNIGQTLSIVGALILGEAAVQAKLVSAPLVIVVALSGTTSLLLPKAANPIMISRTVFFLLAGGLGESGSDAYLSAIIAAVGIIPLLWLYCKLITLSPGSSLFDLAELGMGKILGKAATLLLVFFSLFATGMFLAHYTNFIISILMSRTPKIIIAATIMLTVAYAASRGATALAKASLVFMFLTGLLLCFSVTVSTLALDFSMFPLPPFAHGLKNVLLGSVFVTSTPYGDMLLLLPFAQRLKKRGIPDKANLSGRRAGLAVAYLHLFAQRHYLRGASRRNFAFQILFRHKAAQFGGLFAAL